MLREALTEPWRQKRGARFEKRPRACLILQFEWSASRKELRIQLGKISEAVSPFEAEPSAAGRTMMLL